MPGCAATQLSPATARVCSKGVLRRSSKALLPVTLSTGRLIQLPPPSRNPRARNAGLASMITAASKTTARKSLTQGNTLANRRLPASPPAKPLYRTSVPT